MVGILIAVALVWAGGFAPPAHTELQGLIDDTPPGGVLELGPGVYRGPVVIHRPITVMGVPGTVIDGGGVGTVVTVEAPDVSIIGLTIRASGSSLDREDAGLSVNAPRVRVVGNRLEDVLFGVYLRQSDDSVVSGNVVVGKPLDPARRGDGIRVWQSRGVTVSDNVVEGTRDLVLWFADDLIVSGNRVRNGRYGLHFMYSDTARVEGNTLELNSVGAFLMYSRGLVLVDNVIAENTGPSGYGVGLKDMDGVEASGNRILGNRVGVYFDNSPASLDVENLFLDNLVAYNQVGLLFQPSVRGNVFAGNGFVDNTIQVGVDGGGRFGDNRWTVDGRGNYWSDYVGYDADGDGIGDLPHRVAGLFQALADRNSDLMIFAGTPAEMALEAAVKAFPSLIPGAKLVDEAPLVVPPLTAEASPEPPGVYGWLAASLLIVAGVGVVAAVGRRFGLGSVPWR